MMRNAGVVLLALLLAGCATPAWAEEEKASVDLHVLGAMQRALQRAAERPDIVKRFAGEPRTATHPGAYPTHFADGNVFMEAYDTTATRGTQHLVVTINLAMLDLFTVALSPSGVPFSTGGHPWTYGKFISSTQLDATSFRLLYDITATAGGVSPEFIHIGPTVMDIAL